MLKLVSLTSRRTLDDLNGRRGRNHLRSTGNLDAGNAVLEAVRPQARDVLITHLHLTTLEVWTFKQANLVVLGVL